MMDLVPIINHLQNLNDVEVVYGAKHFMQIIVFEK